jgi:hypothetical protein
MFGIDVVFVFLLLRFVAMTAAASAFTHHHEEESAKRQVPENVWPCCVHITPLK